MRKVVLAVTALVVTLMAGTALGADLIAGNPKDGANVIGTVNVLFDEGNLVVQYLITPGTDWIITKTHLHVALSPEELPQTKKGNANPGQFDYSSSHEVADGKTEVIHTIPLSDIFGDEIPDPLPTLYIAAHAVVGQEFSDDCDELVLDLPEEVTVSVLWAGDVGVDDDSYFDALVSGGTELDGLYDAWCLDTDRSIRLTPGYPRGTPLRALVYSSYDCLSLPLVSPPLVEHCENMDLINWILNNISVGDPAGPCVGSYTYGDIQRAIWELLEDTPSNPGLGPWSPCRVEEIIKAAVANGIGYVPNCGDVVAIILLPYANILADPPQVDPVTGAQVTGLWYFQPIIITIPAPCCLSDETAWAGTYIGEDDDPPDGDGDGYIYEFPGNDWSMYFRITKDD